MSEAMTVVQTTARKWLKGAIDNTIRKRLLFRLAEEKGRISLGHDGYDMNWDIEFRESPISPYGDGGVLTFSRRDNYRQLTLDWRGYKGTDLMTEKEYLMNSGAAAILRRYDKIIPNLLKALTNTFSGEWYVDGNATNNENRLHGLESFLGDAGNTVAADRIAKPTDTYAGRATTPASDGGSWSTDLGTGNYPNATLATDWPFGSGDVQYDHMSPVLANISSTGWGTGSTAWQDNCEIIFTLMTNWLTHKGGEDGKPDVHMLGLDLFSDFQTKQLAKQQIIIPHTKAQDLGIGNVLNFNGVMVASDFDVPAGYGYTLNTDQLELLSLDKVLFHQHGPTWDDRTCEWLFQVGYFGNLRFNPKYFGKMKRYA